MSIILSSIHRVACNDIFRGKQPSDRVGPVPPSLLGFTPMRSRELGWSWQILHDLSQLGHHGHGHMAPPKKKNLGGALEERALEGALGLEPTLERALGLEPTVSSSAYSSSGSQWGRLLLTAEGLSEPWTAVLSELRTAGLSEPWTAGLSEPRTAGLSKPRTAGLTGELPEDLTAGWFWLGPRHHPDTWRPLLYNLVQWCLGGPWGGGSWPRARTENCGWRHTTSSPRRARRIPRRTRRRGDIYRLGQGIVRRPSPWLRGETNRETKNFQKTRKTKRGKKAPLTFSLGPVFCHVMLEHVTRRCRRFFKYKIFNDIIHKETWSTGVRQTIPDVGDKETQGLRTLGKTR